MARRRFFVDAIHAGEAEITGDDASHMARVLRVEPGQLFEISDNRDVWLAEVSTVSKSRVRLVLQEPLTAGPELPPVHLCPALFKFDRLEWLIEKATELGVERIRPVETERSEHGLLAGARKRVERWRRIVREASEQSRRARMPVVDDPVPLADLRAEGILLRLEERAGTEPLRVASGWSGERPVSVLLGPEGGWTDAERTRLDTSGWRAASLGSTVLRAETAGISAMSVLTYLWLQK